MPYLSEQSKSIGKLFALAAVLVALLALLGLLAAESFGGQQDNSKKSASASPVTNSVSPTSEPPHDFHEETPTTCALQADRLREASVALVQAWYDLRPNDTTASRRARIDPYVNPSFYQAHDVEIDKSSPPEISRIAEGYSYSASAKPTDVEVVCPDDFESEAATAIKASVHEKAANGTSVGAPLAVTVSIQWQLEKNGWKAMTLEERW